jgi:hypothetical protein
MKVEKISILSLSQYISLRNYLFGYLQLTLILVHKPVRPSVRPGRHSTNINAFNQY